ncbi:MAG TPA: MgtC/SapB family protein [Steroidobacteraceae bacterium]|jgi:putative Mg2+ transporter-C (MgtC) family protein|nr:MgtC/SapB family protein [Steroidobacteraceae bacterium]
MAGWLSTHVHFLKYVGCRTDSMWIFEQAGQGWVQLGELGLAFVLSALIGVEREIRHKSAGLRTYTLVGFGAALIMLVSKYGFMNVLVNNRVVLDPSRIAAQIVTGIGFIGGGLIFVRRTSVRGLTTAAIVWLTAAIGMACGAGLPILALAVTGGHFVVVFAFPHIASRLPRSRWTPSLLQICYYDGRGVLREVLLKCTQHNFAVSRLQVEKEPPVGAANAADRTITVALEVQGTGSVSKLTSRLADIDGVVSVNAGDINVVTE